MGSVIKTQFKDQAAMGVEGERLTALFLPQYGGKMVSLRDRESGFELLAQDLAEVYLPQTITGSYIENEVSAFDDMFPTIDPVTPTEGSRRGIPYPCHGEVCRVPHCVKEEKGSLSMIYQSKSLQYTYQKEAEVTENGGIRINYVIGNLSEEVFPCLWAGHIMLTAVPGGYGVTPYEEGAPVTMMFDEDGEYGKAGEGIRCKREMLISREYHPKGNAYKFYYQEPMTEGWCGYHLPNLDKTLYLTYDEKKLPYLGIWVNNGIFKEMYNLALEPCTAPYDTYGNAERAGIKAEIAGKSTLTFSIEFDLR